MKRVVWDTGEFEHLREKTMTAMKEVGKRIRSGTICGCGKVDCCREKWNGQRGAILEGEVAGSNRPDRRSFDDDKASEGAEKQIKTLKETEVNDEDLYIYKG